MPIWMRQIQPRLMLAGNDDGEEEEPPMFFTFDPSGVVHLFLALSVGAFIYVMNLFATSRTMLRQEWAMDAFQELYGDPPDETTTSEARQQYEVQRAQFFHQHYGELHGCAHSVCGFARNDVVLSFVPEEEEEEEHEDSSYPCLYEDDTEKQNDLCSVIWRIVATLCCGCCKRTLHKQDFSKKSA